MKKAIAAVLFLVAVAVTGCTSETGSSDITTESGSSQKSDFEKYDDAIKMLKNGDYFNARNEFHALGNYNNSPKKEKVAEALWYYSQWVEKGKPYMTDEYDPEIYEGWMSAKMLFTLESDEFIDCKEAYEQAMNEMSKTGFKRYVDNKISAYKKQKPRVGYTRAEVVATKWGEPKKINKTTTKYGISEQWVYDLNRYVYLEDGIVTAVQE